MSKMSMPQLIAGPALIYTEYISIQLPLKLSLVHMVIPGLVVLNTTDLLFESGPV